MPTCVTPGTLGCPQLVRALGQSEVTVQPAMSEQPEEVLPSLACACLFFLRCRQVERPLKTGIPEPLGQLLPLFIILSKQRPCAVPFWTLAWGGAEGDWSQMREHLMRLLCLPAGIGMAC